MEQCDGCYVTGAQADPQWLKNSKDRFFHIENYCKFPVCFDALEMMQFLPAFTCTLACKKGCLTLILLNIFCLPHPFLTVNQSDNLMLFAI